MTPNAGLLAVMRSLLERDEVDIVKVHPPSEVVVALADGSLWMVHVGRDRALRSVNDEGHGGLPPITSRFGDDEHDAGIGDH